MSGSTQISYRAKETDEKLLLQLAEHLERNISDALRFAVRHTARDYGLLPPKKKPSVGTRTREGKSD